MPIYNATIKKPNGKTEKRFRFEFDRVVNDERIRKTKLLPKGWTQAQADAYERQESEKLYAAATGVRQRDLIAIDEAVKIYLNEKTPVLKTPLQIKRHLLALEWAYSGRKLDKLEDVAQEVTTAYRTAGKAPGTIRLRLGLLRAACRYAAKRLKLARPGDNMEIPAVNNERHVYIDRRQMLQLCRKMYDIRARAIVRIAFYSGMRKMEIFRAIVSGGLFIIDSGISKNAERRVIPIHPKINTALKYRSMIYHGVMWVHFKTAARAAGLPDLRFHDLRHSTASALCNADVDMHTIGKILGHRDQKSTKRYAHLSVETQARALFKIGQKNPTLQIVVSERKAA